MHIERWMNFMVKFKVFPKFEEGDCKGERVDSIWYLLIKL